MQVRQNRGQTIESAERVVGLLEKPLKCIKSHWWIGWQWRRYERSDAFVTVVPADVPAQPCAFRGGHKIFSLEGP